MKTIRIPYQGKRYSVSYKVETIDLTIPNVPFMNVYSVFVDDPELQKLVGDHFTILQNHIQNPIPSFVVNSSGNTDERNIKKAIAQQIMNNPTE
ncbi:MAG: hypothetical protein ICV51_11955 [Flavisolibacter sp.]|nr:hypothetical protein [Flavisolibacter sp.]MBD0367072.1 hypothetical protein [Flavisolibacter sp.]MBD0376332.1 hypothetical protein [Flavisolibacter sp.]